MNPYQPPKEIPKNIYPDAIAWGLLISIFSDMIYFRDKLNIYQFAFKMLLTVVIGLIFYYLKDQE